MNTQHQVILSLGSNQGNRLENIQKAIEAIHLSVGTIVKVSNLYETPAWGFEGDAFYNCALVLHTQTDAETVLEKVLTIEEKLGRAQGISAPGDVSLCLRKLRLRCFHRLRPC